MKTAVEWLIQELQKRDMDILNKDLYQQAKEMEKEQIMNAFDECGMWQDNYSDSEHYYNKTFKSE
jgi:hypothetical protein